MDKYFYLAVTVKQNKNESIFADQEPKEPEAGFYSYVVKCSESDNLKSKLDSIGGLQSRQHLPHKEKSRRACHILERLPQGQRNIFI